MVNYKVQHANRWKLDVPGEASGHFLYEVVEVSTNQVVKSNMTQGEAKIFCRHLNFGGGFDGHTPAFFLEAPKFLYYDEESFYK